MFVLYTFLATDFYCIFIDVGSLYCCVLPEGKAIHKIKEKLK
jgi:hypothetical protein